MSQLESSTPLTQSQPQASSESPPPGPCVTIKLEKNTKGHNFSVNAYHFPTIAEAKAAVDDGYRQMSETYGGQV